LLVGGRPLARGAIQGAKYAAGVLKAELKGASATERKPFRYFDKGSMATVSRFSAVAKFGSVEFGGLLAWLAWLLLHLVYLVGFKSNITTVISWAVTFLSAHRGQLTITEQQAYARTRIAQLQEISPMSPGSRNSAAGQDV
jgi:NADH dehydrogenase